MHDTHNSDGREDEAGVEESVKRNEGGGEVEGHCALKPRSSLAKDGNFLGQRFTVISHICVRGAA
jgi:hypothetical protein